MNELRTQIKEQFASKPLMSALMKLDIVFIGVGFVLLLLGQFLSIGTDLFAGIGFWAFWFGIILSFLNINDLFTVIGLGAYALLNVVVLIIRIITVSAYYGFYGFTPIMNILVAAGLGLLLMLTSSHFKEMNEKRKEAAMQRQQMMQEQAEAQAQAQAQAQQAAQAQSGSNACPNCGALLAEGAVFCSSCGQKVPEKRRCKNCNAELATDARFCPSCGTDNSEPVDETVSTDNSESVDETPATEEQE